MKNYNVLVIKIISIKKNVGENIDSSQIITQIDEYLVETKKLFYKTSE